VYDSKELKSDINRAKREITFFRIPERFAKLPVAVAAWQDSSQHYIEDLYILDFYFEKCEKSVLHFQQE
jgi:hypothetical protein